MKRKRVDGLPFLKNDNRRYIMFKFLSRFLNKKKKVVKKEVVKTPSKGKIDFCTPQIKKK